MFESLERNEKHLLVECQVLKISVIATSQYASFHFSSSTLGSTLAPRSRFYSLARERSLRLLHPTSDFTCVKRFTLHTSHFTLHTSHTHALTHIHTHKPETESTCARVSLACFFGRLILLSYVDNPSDENIPLFNRCTGSLHVLAHF